MEEYKCIKTFISRTDKELFEAIDGLCVGDIRPLRNATGVTFFMPTGEFRKTFIDLAKTDVMKADEIFRACTFDEAYLGVTDLHKAGKIINRLSQEVEVKASGATAELGNGSKITKSKFKSPVGNLAVYYLEGPIPTNGKVVERTQIARKFNKTGAAELSRSRYVLARRVENDYEMFRLGKNGLKCCPYTAELGNLLAYLKHCGDDEGAYDKVMKVMDYNVVAAFYIIFEPYTTTGERVLSDAHFDEYVKKGFCPNPAKMIIDCMNEKGGEMDKAVLKNINETVDANTIRGPASLIQKTYGADKKRQAQDEFRDYVDLELSEEFNSMHFRDLVNEIMSMSSKFNDVKYTVDQLRYIIKPGTEYYSGSYRFIRTTYFNHTPMTESAMSALSAHGSEEYGDYNDTRLVLRNVHHYNKLKSSYSDCTDEFESLKAKLDCYAKCK